MQILFLERNCPSTFRYLISKLEADFKNKLVFISEYIRKDFDRSNISCIQVRIPKIISKGSGVEDNLLQITKRAEQFGLAMTKLKEKGFMPDCICVNASSGCGLYATDIFPGVPQISVFEWFFNKQHDDFFKQFDAVQQFQFGPMRVRNIFQLDALQSSSKSITETMWQKKSYPAVWQKKIQVLPKGVDAEYFSPGSGSIELKQNNNYELVTYISRTISRYGGFETFYRALPELLKARPNCRVLIVGYPERSRDGSQSLLDSLLAEIKLDTSRVYFINFCSFEEYRATLCASDVHVFYTVPLVLSSGMLEAMSCGCLLVASNTEPVQEVIRNGENGILSDFFNHEELAFNIIKALESKEKYTHLRQAARQEIIINYNSKLLTEKYIKLIKDVVK